MNHEAVYEARLELVDFLVEVFHDTPDSAFLERLFSEDVVLPEDDVNEPMDRGFERVDRFIERHRTRPLETVTTELNREYTQLFVGPRPPVHPQETYFRDDTALIGEGLTAVEAAYSAAGWSPPEEYPEENDHVAVELAFVRHLVERQYRGHEEAFGYERVFLDEHLLRWYRAFHDDLAEELDDATAESNLFLAASEVFVGFVEFEDELVAQQVPS